MIDGSYSSLMRSMGKSTVDIYDAFVDRGHC